VDALLIDDFERDDGMSRLGTEWRVASDRVMGGLSSGRMSVETVDGRRALCMRGEVSLANNGGFLQVTLDLAREGSLDCRAFSGIRLVVRGNGEAYNIHLKTADIEFPWQSYRAGFLAESRWREITLPFEEFRPHRVDVPLDVRRLRRLGVVAIGRELSADLSVAELGFYRDSS